MFVLGLTGSMAMGKTTTARLFAEAGVPVFDADAAVHALYEGEGVAPVEALFPGVSVDGKIDRQRLTGHVVGKPDQLKKLEAVIHPLVRAREQEFLQKAGQAGAKVALLDIPLLFETGAESRVDAVVVVSAPAAVQRARVLERGAMTAEKLDALLARQLPDAVKRQRADFVVDTSQGLEPVRIRVHEILERAAKMPRRRQG